MGLRKSRVFFIEFGIGFGGSVVSLSELIKGFEKLDVVIPTVLTFQESHVIEGLFSDQVKLLNHNRLFSYRRKSDFSQWVDSKAFLSTFKSSLLKIYAFLDTVHDYYLSVLLAILFKSNKAEIVHLNNGYQKPAIRAARWLNLPCFVHMRGFPIHKEGEERRFASKFNSYVSGCIGISDAVSKATIEAGADPVKMVTIFNPLDIELYQSSMKMRSVIRDQYQLNDEQLVFGIFGRVTTWKGQLEFLQAVEKIIDRCPNMVAMIIGDSSDTGDTDYHEKVYQLVDKLSLKCRVILTGYQNQVYNYYAAVDVVLHNSTEPEPFGRVVIEGMAANNVIIAMDEGGPKEILSHEEDGILVEPRNTERLAEALEMVYKNPALREKLSAAALRKVSSEYPNDAIANKVYEFYERRGAW